MPPPSPDTPAHDSGHRQRPGLGIVIMLGSIGCFACMTATIKQVTTDYSIFQILFFGSAVMLPFVALFLYCNGGLGAFRSRGVPLTQYSTNIQR